jgi:GrpB-like predicted nucleotidyltransferase (UPF0157 family)
MIVDVVPYRLEWRKGFEIEKEVLIKYFGRHISEIHHIGSTSVSGLLKFLVSLNLMAR